MEQTSNSNSLLRSRTCLVFLGICRDRSLFPLGRAQSTHSGRFAICFVSCVPIDAFISWRPSANSDSPPRSESSF